MEKVKKHDKDFLMFKEINENYDAFSETFDHIDKSGILKNIDFLSFNKIVFVGCGTAFHAGLTGSYLIQSVCKFPACAIFATELTARKIEIDKKSLYVFISQSGETSDTLEALNYVKESKAKTLGIINVEASSMSRLTDYLINTKAGEEKAVASTKVYITQLTAVYKIAEKILTEVKGKNENFSLNKKEIQKAIKKVLTLKKPIKQLAEKIKCCESVYFIGRSLDYSTALESALKTKESTYIHAEAIAAGEFKHGPIALLDNNSFVFVFATQQGLINKNQYIINEIKKRGSTAVVLSQLPEFKKEKDLISLPELDDLLMPLISIIPVQLLAFYTARAKGSDPDSPRGLTKAVII